MTVSVLFSRGPSLTIKTMIQFDRVSFSYGEKEILHNIQLQFEPGKCHVILGPSGSGKSTLLRLIAGLISPSLGQLTAPKTYGYVLQEGGLFPHLSVSENISIQGQNLKWPKQKIQSRLLELCSLTQLDPKLLLLYPNQLSGGQRQRVALMRGLFMEPEVLLLDESLSALDPLLKYELMRDLREIILALKKTTIVVTHDLVEASVLGDQITLLFQGRIEVSTSKSEFFKNPQSSFAQKFIQSQRVLE